MSVRTERLTQEASQFKLRDFVNSASTGASDPAHFFLLNGNGTGHKKTSEPAHGLASHEQPTPVPPKLTFSLNLPSNHKANAQNGVFVTSASSPSPNLTFSLPQMRRVVHTATIGKTNISSAPSIESASRSGQEEVLRMAGMLDDSRSKVAKLQNKLSATETSVARANQSLTSERAAFNARLAALSNELRAARDIEQKLRVEIANSPSKIEAERQAETFRLQAQGAVELEREFTMAKQRVALLEKQVEASNASLLDTQKNLEALQSEHHNICTLYGQAQALAASIPTPLPSPCPTLNDETLKDETLNDGVTEEAMQTAIERAVEEARMLDQEEHEKTLRGHDTAMQMAKADVEVQMGRVKELQQELQEAREMTSMAVSQKAETEKQLRQMNMQIEALNHELPVPTKTQMARYSELRAASERLGNSGGPKAYHARRRAQEAFRAIATGEPVVPPSVTRAPPKQWSTGSALLATFMASCQKTGVPCSATAASPDIDLHSYPTGAIVFSMPRSNENTPPLATQADRVNAAIAAISGDLKGLFIHRQKVYAEAVNRKLEL